MKLVSPEKIFKMMPWTTELPILVKITGLIDLLTGVGLVFPVILNFKLRLILWTANGFALLMVFAIIFHLLRGEVDKVPMNIVLFFITLFITWGWNKKLRSN